MFLSRLHEAVAAVAPINGVSVGLVDDKSTWSVDFAGATDQQKAAAALVMSTFDPNEPTFEMVDAERDRRLLTVTFNGKAFQFVDGKGSDLNIAGGFSLALAAILNGAQPGDLRWSDPDQDFYFIASDNTQVTMDAQTMVAFGKHAAAWKQQHIYAARVLKNMSPIPADYTADVRWGS